jgi:hypothetical protein
MQAGDQVRHRTHQATLPFLLPFNIFRLNWCDSNVPVRRTSLQCCSLAKSTSGWQPIIEPGTYFAVGRLANHFATPHPNNLAVPHPAKKLL